MLALCSFTSRNTLVELFMNVLKNFKVINGSAVFKQ